MFLRIATRLLTMCLFALFVILSPKLYSQAYPPVEIIIDDTCGFKGNRVCVDFKIINCTKVEGLNFIVSFDPTILSIIKPIDYADTNWPGLDASEFIIYEDIMPPAVFGKGNVNFLYFDGDPVTLPDSSKIFTLCFDIIGEPGQISPIFINAGKLPTELTQTSPTNPTQAIETPLMWNNGSVKVKGNGVSVYATTCGATNPALDNGTITFLPGGGKDPYSYTLDGGVPVTGLKEGEAVTLSNLGLGVYTIIITDAMGAVSPPKVVVVNQTLPFTYTETVKNPSCFHTNTQNGSVELMITDGGAFAPDTYKYKWSTFEFDKTKINELATGQYFVTITDLAGCSVVDSFDLAATPITYKVEVTNSLCAGKRTGEIRIIDVAGGVGGPFDHFFDGIDRKLVNVFSNLNADTFDIRVRDAGGCSTLPEKFVVKFDRDLTLSSVIKDVTCSGKTDGEISVSGAPANLRFSWKLNNVGGFLIGPTDNTYFINMLGVGQDTLYAIDPDGCRDTLVFDIKDTAPININSVIVQPDCLINGSIAINPSGGSGTYTYTWDPIQPPGTKLLTNLTGDTFKVTVTDQNACSKDTTIVLNTAGNLNITVTPTNVSCDGKNDGKATVNVIATGMITIIWRDSDNMALPQQTNTVNNLPPGNYTVEVSDATGCKATKAFTIAGSTPLQFSHLLTQPKCNGDKGIISVTVAGASNVTYEWIKVGTPTTVLDTDNLLSNVGGGDYKVTIKYGNGCQKDTTFKLLEPPKVTFGAVTTNRVTCFGLANGQATVANPATGITLRWSSGEVGAFAIKYPAGNHYVIATDANGCKSDTAFFEVFTFPPLMLDEGFTSIERPTCFGSKDGSLTVVALGGSGLGYKYNWISPASTLPTITNVGSGDYIIEISDDKNCVVRDTITLLEPVKLNATIDNSLSVELDCNNTENGKLVLKISGGNPGIKNVSWQSGILTDGNTAIRLTTGTYCATVSDNKGCRDTVCYTLSAPEKLVGEINQPAPLSCNGSTTCISVKSLVGGTGNKYTFQINNGLRFPIDSCVAVFAGSYFISLIDSAGCSIDTLIEIGQPDPIAVNVGPDIELQLGLPGAILNATVETPYPIDTLIWTPMDSVTCLTANCQSVSLAPSTTTTYTLQVVDGNGCTGNDQITVTVKDIRNVYFANVFSPNGDGFNDYFQVVVGPDVKEVETFNVYDRWGNLMFSKESYVPDLSQTDGWDGTFNGAKLDPGVFVFMAKVTFIDDKVSFYKGNVTLVDKRRN